MYFRKIAELKTQQQQPSVDSAQRRHGCSSLSEERIQSRALYLYVPAPLASPPRKSWGNAADPGRSSGLVDTQVKYQLRCRRKNPAGHEPLRLDGSRRSACSVSILLLHSCAHTWHHFHLHSSRGMGDKNGILRKDVCSCNAPVHIRLPHNWHANCQFLFPPPPCRKLS